jgi:hypothetical protein
MTKKPVIIEHLKLSQTSRNLSMRVVALQHPFSPRILWQTEKVIRDLSACVLQLIINNLISLPFSTEKLTNSLFIPKLRCSR